MYSYRPEPKHIPHKPLPLTRMAKSPVHIKTGGYLLAGVMLGLGLLNGANHLLYTKTLATMPSAESIILPLYSQKVSAETNVAQLTKTGQNLLAKKLPLYAAVNFKRASDLDPNYRDAAYGWAYALLQAKGTNESSDDLASLDKAIARAEAVDPLYLPLLKLKVIVANLEQKPAVTKATQARMDLLNKSNN